MTENPIEFLKREHPALAAELLNAEDSVEVDTLIALDREREALRAALARADDLVGQLRAARDP